MTDKLDKVKQDAWNIASDYHLQLECEEQDIIKAEQTENPERQVFNLTEPHNRKTNEVVENWLSIPIPVEPERDCPECRGERVIPVLFHMDNFDYKSHCRYCGHPFDMLDGSLLVEHERTCKPQMKPCPHCQGTGKIPAKYMTIGEIIEEAIK